MSADFPDGGEGGIRTGIHQDLSASCRFDIAGDAKNATNDVAHCPKLPDA